MFIVSVIIKSNRIRWSIVILQNEKQIARLLYIRELLGEYTRDSDIMSAIKLL